MVCLPDSYNDPVLLAVWLDVQSAVEKRRSSNNGVKFPGLLDNSAGGLCDLGEVQMGHYFGDVVDAPSPRRSTMTLPLSVIVTG